MIQTIESFPLNMVSRINVENIVPEAFQIPPVVTGSKSLLRTNYVQYNPEVEAVHSFTGINTIRFNVSSTSDFLVGPECFWQLQIKNVNSNNFDHTFDIGGIHSCIRHITVRNLGTGFPIQRIRHYNRWYCLMSSIYHTQDYVHKNLWAQGQGLNSYDRGTDEGCQWESLLITNYAGGGGALTVSSAANLYVGQPIIILDDQGNLQPARVFSNTYPVGNDILLDDYGIYNPGLAFGSILFKRDMAANPGSMFLPFNKDYVKMSLKPALSFLHYTIPTPLFKAGIQFEFEFESPDIAFHNSDGTVAPTIEYSNFVFHAKMVTPHQAVLQDYFDKWKSPQGIVYPIPSVETRRIADGATATDSTIQTNLGVRSARRLLMVIQDSLISETSGTQLSRRSHSLSTFLRDHITSFQVQVGSHLYPLREVQCDIDSTEAFQYLLNTCNMNDKPIGINPNDWRSTNTLAVNDAGSPHRYMSKRFIMAVDLSRGNGDTGMLTGLDLSVVPVNIRLTRNLSHQDQNYINYDGDTAADAGIGLAGTPILFIFCPHDALLVLSKSQNVVMT